MNFDENAILMAKICGIALFSSVSVIISLLPMFIHAHYKRKDPGSEIHIGNESKYKNAISHLSAFGGGVLLSTTFLHLLPEIRESIETLRREKVVPYTRSLPLAELLMCLGFLFLYLIEELAHKVVGRLRQQKIKNECVVRFVNDVYISTSSEISINLGLPEDSATPCGTEVIEPSIGNGSQQSEDRVKQKIAAKEENCNNRVLPNAKRHSEPLVCVNDSTIFFTEGSGKNFLLIFALSIHEGFEGLAIGLESQPEAVWYMILGVGAHKAVIAFCIGVQMFSSKIDRKVAILFVFVFATATPLGVTIGLFLYTGGGIFSIILQGLATGTLLHVVFFELLKPHSEHSPFVGVFIGFICMAVLKYYSP